MVGIGAPRSALAALPEDCLEGSCGLPSPQTQLPAALPLFLGRRWSDRTTRPSQEAKSVGAVALTFGRLSFPSWQRLPGLFIPESRDVRRRGLLEHTDATTRRPLGRVIHYEKLRSRRGPCDTSSVLKTGPSGNCRRFSIRRRASGPIPFGRCCRAGPGRRLRSKALCRAQRRSKVRHSVSNRSDGLDRFRYD